MGTDSGSTHRTPSPSRAASVHTGAKLPPGGAAPTSPRALQKFDNDRARSQTAGSAAAALSAAVSRAPQRYQSHPPALIRDSVTAQARFLSTHSAPAAVHPPAQLRKRDRDGAAPLATAAPHSHGTHDPTRSSCGGGAVANASQAPAVSRDPLSKTVQGTQCAMGGYEPRLFHRQVCFVTRASTIRSMHDAHNSRLFVSCVSCARCPGWHFR